MTSDVVKVKVKNNSHHPLPQYETEGSAGMDLRAVIDSSITKVYANGYIEIGVNGAEDKVVLQPMGRALIDTGIQIQLPVGYEVQIRPRSGLSLKKGIVAQLGTIDSDYRGHIGIILINLGTEKFVINDGDRLAQMVLKKVERIEWDEVAKLSKTERGEGGFGHTGKE